jgi:CBS domain-containing protein
MKVAKVMRTDVVALRADAAIDAAWRRMREQRLDTLPVINLVGTLIGVLTEHDLLARLAPRRQPAWWWSLVDDKDRLSSDYLRTVGTTVGEIMRERCPAVVPDAPIETAAALMQRQRLSALPVMANDVCVGLVTRADVLDHLSWPGAGSPGGASDVELECLMREAIARELWASRLSISVGVAGGVIRLTGAVSNATERTALLAMARTLPGASGVEDRLCVTPGWGQPLPAAII